MILTVNTGSSSIKISLFKTEHERISVQLKHYDASNYEGIIEAQNHDPQQFALTKLEYENPVQFTITKLLELTHILDTDRIRAVTYRVVHGGTEFIQPTKLDSESISRLEKYNELAPLHNPVALDVIKKKIKHMPDTAHYAFFDTAFHATIQKEQYLYGLPYGYYENIGVRKFGFHGLSYAYTVQKLQTELKTLPARIIACHLGSGSSVCAIQKGQSIATSFGFSPEENLIMATRSGEIDYSAIMFIKKKLGLKDTEIETLLNKESGLLGISGYTNNMKQLLDDYETNERAKLAVDMYIDKIVSFIADYFVLLQGVDAVIFTGGIGSGSDIIRNMILQKLHVLGIMHDENKNQGKQDVSDFLDISGRTNVYVIKADEERYMFGELSRQMTPAQSASHNEAGEEYR